MDRAALTARLADLRAGEAALRDSIAQGQRSLDATTGAIAECERWLAQIAPTESAGEGDYPRLKPSSLA